MVIQTAINETLKDVKTTDKSTLDLADKKDSKSHKQTYDDKLHKRFILWRDQSGKSLGRIATMVGRSAALVHGYVHKQYEGDVKAFEKDIANLLRREEELEFVERPAVFCATMPSTLIYEVLEFCDRKCKMGVAVAPSGTGKSETCKEYKRRNRQSIYVLIKITTRSIGSLLHRIGERTGSHPQKATLDNLLESIIDKLKGSHRLLVLDDAHYLSWEQVETLKALHDCAGIGIVLIGQERLYDQMKGGDQRAMLFDQTYSRIAIKRDRFPIEKKDVEQIADSICAGLSGECVDYLMKKAHGKGRFRTMKDLLDVAVEMHKYGGEPINLDLLKKADQFLLKG